MASSNGNGNGADFEEVQIVQTTDEEGTIHVFEKVDELEVDGKEYALLIYHGTQEGDISLEELLANSPTGKPASQEGEEAEDEDGEEVMVMRILHADDGAEIYENIDDEEEFERVASHIKYLEEDEEDDSEGLGIDEDDIELDPVKLGELLSQLDDDDKPSKN